jgi:hypothetical protein
LSVDEELQSQIAIPTVVGVPANNFHKNKKVILYLSMHLNYYTEFLTGTIYNWQHLLNNDKYKQIIIDSFQWLVTNKNVQ